MNLRVYYLLFALGIVFLSIPLLKGWQAEKAEHHPEFVQQFAPGLDLPGVKQISIHSSENQLVADFLLDDNGYWRISNLDNFPAAQSLLRRQFVDPHWDQTESGPRPRFPTRPHPGFDSCRHQLPGIELTQND